MASEQPITELPKAELAVLQTLWEQGTSTIRQLADLLYPGGKAAQYGTVQKLLERLEQKGCVERDRSAFVHTIAAKVGREQFAAARLAETAEKLAHGSLKPLFAHLVESDQLSPQELDEIRALIQKHRKKKT